MNPGMQRFFTRAALVGQRVRGRARGEQPIVRWLDAHGQDRRIEVDVAACAVFLRCRAIEHQRARVDMLTSSARVASAMLKTRSRSISGVGNGTTIITTIPTIAAGIAICPMRWLTTSVPALYARRPWHQRPAGSMNPVLIGPPRSRLRDIPPIQPTGVAHDTIRWSV